MSTKHQNKSQSDLIYSPLTEGITSNCKTTDETTNQEPIYFDPNILCCPYCGNKDVNKAGVKYGKQSYKCKNKICKKNFVDPSAREKCIAHNVKCRFCGSTNCRKAGFSKINQQKYFCKDCKSTFNPNAKGEKILKLAISEDVWLADSLNVKPIGTDGKTKFNFTKIYQPWFKELVKKFIKFKSINSEYNTLNNYLVKMRKFSLFLYENYPEIAHIQDLNREIIIDFIIYLKSYSYSTVAGCIGTLKNFLNIGNQNNWFTVSSHLILDTDYPKYYKSKPRYIPKVVLKQLEVHAHLLPRTLQIMVYLFLDTGFRYSTLARIPLNCLELNNNQWWIYRDRVKIPEGYKSPISSEVAEKIKEQQSFIKSYFKDNKYLFAPREQGNSGDNYIPQKNKLILLNNFLYYLNKLALNHQIRDDNGKTWKFSSHQFRHTFGTEAINNGVPQHIVMKLLGHSSPEMTMRYAHIHDETLRKELAKFHENRTIDITGQIVSLELEGEPKDLEWFTKEICAIALPNGYCGRPKVLGDCDIAGDVGCYLCPHFRTNKNFLSVHKEQLESIDKLLAKAYKYNWQLPIKKNEPIKQNLKLIISTLEADNEQAQ